MPARSAIAAGYIRAQHRAVVVLVPHLVKSVRVVDGQVGAVVARNVALLQRRACGHHGAHGGHDLQEWCSTHNIKAHGMAGVRTQLTTGTRP